MPEDRTFITATGGDDPVNETARAAIVGGDDLFMRKSLGVMVSPHSRGMRYWPKDSVVVLDDPDSGVGAVQKVPEGYISTLVATEKEWLAVYHALADHFGHSVHDARQIRRDLDAERKRSEREMDAERARGDKAMDALITIATREVTMPVPPAPPAHTIVVNVPSGDEKIALDDETGAP